MSAMDWALALTAASIVAGYLWMMTWLIIKMVREIDSDD